jgi:hypothetical protein
MKSYIGYRGSGKTLNIVSEIEKEFHACVRKNIQFVLVTNTPLFIEPYKGEDLRQFLYNDIECISHFFSYCMSEPWVTNGCHTIVLIDEANIMLPARYWKNTPKDFSPFLQQSRHFSVDFWYTTQAIKYVDVNLLRVTDEFIQCSPFPNYPKWMYDYLPFFCKTFAIRLDTCDVDPTTGNFEVISTKYFFRPSRSYGKYYTKYNISMPNHVSPTSDGISNTAVHHYFREKVYQWTRDFYKNEYFQNSLDEYEDIQEKLKDIPSLDEILLLHKQSNDK